MIPCERGTVLENSSYQTSLCISAPQKHSTGDVRKIYAIPMGDLRKIYGILVGDLRKVYGRHVGTQWHPIAGIPALQPNDSLTQLTHPTHSTTSLNQLTQPTHSLTPRPNSLTHPETPIAPITFCSASRHSTPPGTATNGCWLALARVVMASSCAIRSGTYLSTSARLAAWVPIAAPAFARCRGCAAHISERVSEHVRSMPVSATGGVHTKDWRTLDARGGSAQADRSVLAANSNPGAPHRHLRDQPWAAEHCLAYEHAAAGIHDGYADVLELSLLCLRERRSRHRVRRFQCQHGMTWREPLWRGRGRVLNRWRSCERGGTSTERPRGQLARGRELAAVARPSRQSEQGERAESH